MRYQVQWCENLFEAIWRMSDVYPDLPLAINGCEIRKLDFPHKRWRIAEVDIDDFVIRIVGDQRMNSKISWRKYGF